MKDHISIGAGGRLLVFGGNYGNLQATQALFAEAETLGIGPDAMLCTGDLAAYCADPQATTRLVRETGVPVVMGNGEDSLASAAEDCGCGYASGTTSAAPRSTPRPSAGWGACPGASRSRSAAAACWRSTGV
jgi:hypothetical protein